MMRPDLEDYEDVADQPDLDYSRSRAMSWLVLGVAVAGFGALAYYAYHSGTQSVRSSGEVPVIEADKAPLKEVPANPEGEQFANKDKTIYDVVAGDKPEKQVEKLLPDAEHPTAIKAPEKDGYEESDQAPARPANTTTYVKQDEEDKKVTAAPVAAKKEIAKPAETPSASKPAAPAASPEAPKLVNEKPVVEKKEAVASKPAEPAKAPVADAKPLAKAEAKPAKADKPAAATPAAAGSYKIQLGAFQSEAEALGQWKKITAKFGGVVKGSPIVVKAELEKGTYYRLRAGGFASAQAAKDACAQLSAKSQPCFPAGK